MFWPREIWGRYAEQLADFQHQRHSKAAVQCLNHMITDALRSADVDGAYQICICSRAAHVASPFFSAPCSLLTASALHDMPVHSALNLSAASAADTRQLLDVNPALNVAYLAVQA